MSTQNPEGSTGQFANDEFNSMPAAKYVYVATLFENPAWGLRDSRNRDHFMGVKVGSTYALAEMQAKIAVKGFRSGSYQIEKVEVE